MSPDLATDIDEILRATRTIAVIGLSPSPERDSHRVARYLADAGYRIIPVNPKAEQVLGERSFPSLEAVPDPVDLALVFRRPVEVPVLAEAALEKGVQAFWMQQGIRHEEAARLLRGRGVRVVEDRCAMVEHKKVFPA